MPNLTWPVSTATRSLGRVREKWPAIVVAFESPVVAYSLLILFQLKRIWSIWMVRDVSGGDTTWYFANALRWYHDAAVVMAWSPLYTAFYGSFLFVNPDPVWATVAHRVVIVLTTAVLVLAVLRQLLPPTFAWLCAAWWAFLPISFDTLYEVHLFALMPVLVSWLLLATACGPWRRAAALMVLGVAAVLIRNELVVAFGLFALFLTAYEVRGLRSGRGKLWTTLLAYGLAGLTAGVLCGLAYLRSDVRYPELSEVMASKHRVNMAQVYAFGHKQRHPEWTHDHWTECYGLMQDTFGVPAPTLREMIAANPKAVAEHFAWNVSLTLSGLQLLLFDKTCGSTNPDYFPDSDNRLNRVLPGILGGLVLVTWGFGLVCLWRGRDWWGGGQATCHQLAWAGIAAVATVAPLIILTQRPRPSYLFALSAGLMAVTGLCAWAAATKWGGYDRLRRAMPVVMVAMVLLAPGHFRVHASHGHRPMATAIERLRPHAADLSHQGMRALTPNGVAGVGVYLTGQSGEFVEFSTIVGRWSADESFAACLTRERINLVYLDEVALTHLQQNRFEQSQSYIEGRDTPGWKYVDGSDVPKQRWRYFRRFD